MFKVTHLTKEDLISLIEKSFPDKEVLGVKVKNQDVVASLVELDGNQTIVLSKKV